MKSVPVDQNLFATFVAQRNNSLIDRIHDVDRTSSAEHIRRLRVGIKRWRTILLVVTDLILPRLKSEKAERSIQRLFKWAGTIRDCQLDRQLLARMSLPVRLKKKLQHLLKKREKKACKRLKKAIRKVKLKKVRKFSLRMQQHALAIAPKRISHQLSRFLDHECCAIEVLLASEVSSENLHSIRKHLKSLIEIGSVISTITPNKSLGHLIQRAKTGQRRLGNWHDSVSLRAQISAYMADHACGLSPEKIITLSDRLEAKTQRETKRICLEVDNVSSILSLLAPWRTEVNEIALGS